MNQTKLLVHLMIDTSASVEGTKRDAFESAMNNFLEYVANTFHAAALEIAITCYDDFEPQRLSAFTTVESKVDLPYERFPLLGRTLFNVLSNVEKRVNELIIDNQSYYKPWIIILSDGISYDKADDALNKFSSMDFAVKPVMFPFLLSSNKVNENARTFEHHKHFVEIRDHRYNQMFQWLGDLIKTRLNTPVDQKMTLNKSQMLEWIKQ